MSIMDFIRSNRKGIDETIKSNGITRRINDDERRRWILNDEGLYMWARSNGVNI